MENPFDDMLEDVKKHEESSKTAEKPETKEVKLEKKDDPEKKKAKEPEIAPVKEEKRARVAPTDSRLKERAIFAVIIVVLALLVVFDPFSPCQISKIIPKANPNASVNMTAQAENIEDYYDYTNRVLGKEMQLNSYPVKETDFIMPLP